MTPIYCLTNDKHIHLCQPFIHFWNKYSGLPVTIVGYSQPDFTLPVNFNFLSLGKQQPANKWSNSLMQLCDIAPDNFILLLEDYWLYAPADNDAIIQLSDKITDDILRIDLSGNRISYAHQAIAKFRDYHIIQSVQTAKYMMSFQAAIWNKDNLKSTLRPNETPWQSEIDGSFRVGHKVLGTNPSVLKYTPVWRSGKKQWQLRNFNVQDHKYCTDWIQKQK